MKASNAKNGTLSTSAIISALGGIQQKLRTVTTLNRKQRKTLKARQRLATDELISCVLQEAEKNGGTIAGIVIDVPAARAALAAVAEFEEASDSARRIAALMEDEAVQRRSGVADRAFAVYMALRRLVHTPEGESLARTYEEMAAAVPRAKKGSRAKKGGASKAEPPPPPPGAKTDAGAPSPMPKTEPPAPPDTPNPA